MSKNKSPILKSVSIFTLYCIYLFDIAAIVVVLVLFSDLIINSKNSILPSSTSIHTRNVILGLLYAAYPLTQFFGAPILGELSDRFGRKIIINISTIGTVCAFFLTAISILQSHIALLFLSRLMGGFFAGNESLAQATVSGLVKKKNRSKAMALFAAVGGFSWIVGPFLGTFFSNPKIVSWFGLDTPFWFLGFVVLFCWGLFMVSYQCMHEKQGLEKLSIRECFKSLMSIFDEKIIITPFVASLISMMGWMIVQSFFSPYLMEKFKFTSQSVGYAFAYMSIWWLCGGLVSMVIFKFKKPSLFITMTSLIAALFVIIYTIDRSHLFIYWAVPVANFSYAISYSAYMALFAHILPTHMQGRLYGSWVGGFALASAIAPALGGWISFVGLGVPFIIGGIIVLISTGAYYVWYQKNLTKLQNLEI